MDGLCTILWDLRVTLRQARWGATGFSAFSVKGLGLRPGHLQGCGLPERSNDIGNILACLGQRIVNRAAQIIVQEWNTCFARDAIPDDIVPRDVGEARSREAPGRFNATTTRCHFAKSTPPSGQWTTLRIPTTLPRAAALAVSPNGRAIMLTSSSTSQIRS